MTLIFILENSYLPLLGILFAVLHELGHLTSMYLTNNTPKQLSFGILSIEILSLAEEDFENDIPVFLSGPAVNIVLGIIFLLIFKCGGNYIVEISSIQNFILAFVNLLPISTLDGGKILKSVLSKKFNINDAERIVNLISVIFTIPIFILGFFILINSKYSISILIIICYLISYIFCKESNILI